MSTIQKIRWGISALTVLATVLGAPLTAAAEPGELNAPKKCQLVKATPFSATVPPVLLLEGNLCEDARVFLGQLGGVLVEAEVLSATESAVEVDITGHDSPGTAELRLVCGDRNLAAGCSLSAIFNVDDADADPTNEIQDLSHPPGSICISDGGCVPDETQDEDADPTNEIQVLRTEIRGDESTQLLCEAQKAECVSQCLAPFCTCSCDIPIGGFQCDCTCTLGCDPSPCRAEAPCIGTTRTDCADTGEELASCLDGGDATGGESCEYTCSRELFCFADPPYAEKECRTTCRGAGGTRCTRSCPDNLIGSRATCLPPSQPCTLGTRAICLSLQ